MRTAKTNTQISIDIFPAELRTELRLHFAEQGVSAGFPSPAFDFEDTSIDLNEHLISNPAATFYGRVKGDSLKNAGISDGDLLIIDRSSEPANGKIAVCYIDGEFTAKRIQISESEVLLIPENENYETIRVTEENDFLIWGIVSYAIKKF